MIKFNRRAIDWLFVSQSYRRCNGYIITQMPLPHTVIDLWRMVFEHDSATIVMLNPSDETDEVFLLFYETTLFIFILS